MVVGPGDSIDFPFNFGEVLFESVKTRDDFVELFDELPSEFESFIDVFEFFLAEVHTPIVEELVVGTDVFGLDGLAE